MQKEIKFRERRNKRKMKNNLKEVNFLENKKTIKERGITLIALVVTIVVLLILASVSITVVFGDNGLIEMAREAANKTNEAVEENQKDISELENFLGNYLAGGGTISPTPTVASKPTTVAEAVTQNYRFTENTYIQDEYGNSVTIPAGFKILVDETTTYEDNNNPHVTDGIVIQDSQENEFVWIPVGKIYTDVAKTESSAKIITLGRYRLFEGEDPKPVQSREIKGFDAEFKMNFTCQDGDFEEQVEYVELPKNSSTSTGHIRALDIVAFCKSAERNGGYYIGRYEAGDSERNEKRTGIEQSGTLVCKKEQFVYNYILAGNASIKCQEMYESEPFTSDLMNSYAWDTAIVFIQKCGTEENASSYAKVRLDYYEGKTGMSKDKYRNIYEMAGNYDELTTELDMGGRNVIRGRK